MRTGPCQTGLLGRCLVLPSQIRSPWAARCSGAALGNPIADTPRGISREWPGSLRGASLLAGPMSSLSKPLLARPGNHFAELPLINLSMCPSLKRRSRMSRRDLHYESFSTTCAYRIPTFLNGFRHTITTMASFCLKLQRQLHQIQFLIARLQPRPLLLQTSISTYLFTISE